MTNTRSLLRQIKDRKSVIDVDINSKIKFLQRKLVSLSFTNGNNSIEYFATLGKIRTLRNEILK